MTDINSTETFLYIYPFNSYIRRNLLYRESNFVSDSLCCGHVYLLENMTTLMVLKLTIYVRHMNSYFLILFLNFDSSSQSLKKFSH